jgi:hypothetical protein
MWIYAFISFCLFFIVHFWFTQKIYSHNYFIIVLLFSLVILFGPLLTINKTDWQKNFPLLLLVFVFVLILFVIKKMYKKLNNLLIRKKLIKKEYSGKDFTYVLWDSDVNIPDWWDEKLALKPSWLDYILTYLLLILPILLLIPLGKLFN